MDEIWGISIFVPWELPLSGLMKLAHGPRSIFHSLPWGVPLICGPCKLQSFPHFIVHMPHKLISSWDISIFFLCQAMGNASFFIHIPCKTPFFIHFPHELTWIMPSNVLLYYSLPVRSTNLTCWECTVHAPFAW